MMVKAVQQLKGAMFPIFRYVTTGNQVGLGVSGTGYFINDQGMFVTTAHVFDDATAHTQFAYHGLLPDKLQNPWLAIKEIARDDKNDLYIGKIEVKNSSFLQFSDQPIEIGRTVCIAGYPLALITLNAQGGFELGGVRRYFQPSFILDFTSASVPNAKGFIRTHAGFLIRDFGLYGMSGGPVVDINGLIVGMQASVSDPRESTNGVRTITVQNALAISGERIRELLKKHDIKFSVSSASLQSDFP
jgi:S1-C subfamily serine protease